MDNIFGLIDGILAGLAYRSMQESNKQLGRHKSLLEFTENTQALGVATAFKLLEIGSTTAAQYMNISSEGRTFVKGTGIFRGITGCDRPLFSLMDN